MGHFFAKAAAAGMSYSTTFSGGASNPIGTPWISGPGAFIDIAQTAGSRAEGTGGNSGAVINPASYAFAGNHSASVTVDTANACGPAVRMQAGTSECYVAYMANSTTVLVLKVDNALGTSQIGADVTTSTISAGSVVTLLVTGSGTLRVLLDSVQQGTDRTDASSPYSGGQPGMYINGFSQFTAFSAVDV